MNTVNKFDMAMFLFILHKYRENAENLGFLYAQLSDSKYEISSTDLEAGITKQNDLERELRNYLIQ